MSDARRWNIPPLAQFFIGAFISFVCFILVIVMAMVTQYSWIGLLLAGACLGIIGPWAILGGLLILLPAFNSAINGLPIALILLLVGSPIGFVSRQRFMRASQGYPTGQQSRNDG
jgi:hypothetical protein